MKRTLKFITVLSAFLILFGLLSFVTSDSDNISKVIPKRNPIVYDFSCMQSSDDLGEEAIINLGHDIEDVIVGSSGVEVSIEEEERAGDQVYESQKSKIVHNEKSENLERMLQKLVAQIKKPKGYHYSIYFLESNDLNAWTCGGKIFVTSKIYEFCESNDEMACILGHEINHNELGHIKKKLQKWKLMGDLNSLYSMFTIPFGQKDEAHCDLTGIDLVFAAGYDACVNVELWKRMKKAFNEGDFDPVNNLFRSHPYSSSRSECSKHHIRYNYDVNCD